MALKRGIDKAVKAITEQLQKDSKPISGKKRLHRWLPFLQITTLRLEILLPMLWRK